MITLNNVLVSVLERAGDNSGVGLAIRIIWGQRSKEGELLDAFAELAAQAQRDGTHYEELNKVVRFGDETATIDDMVGDSEWWDSLDNSVRQMQAHSSCGADCLALIIRADMVLNDMMDIADTDFRSGLMLDVARQCEVFVNG
jgi:hypothetical protein